MRTALLLLLAAQPGPAATNAVGFGGCPCYAGAQALLDAQKDPATGTLAVHTQPTD